MNDYKRLTDNLRSYSQDLVAYKLGCAFADAMDAADAIEQLGKDNAVLTKERDAAVADIPRACGYCKWYVESDDECVRMFPCNNISGVNTGWEWRGVQEVEHEAD